MYRGGGLTKGDACRLCGESSQPVSRALGVCGGCIRERPQESLPLVRAAHRRARELHGLPAEPPRAERGLSCSLCSNECVMGEGERGFCGLRRNEGGLKSLVDTSRGLLYAYLDPHVTNCCSAWFCPAGTGVGYPEYARSDGPERGYANLAVFMYGCNFDCLFCQNPSHKAFGGVEPTTVERFAGTVASNPRVSCVCFFGGSPESQLPFILKASEAALERRRGTPLRICFEWNGCGDPSMVRRAAEMALETGGNIKFDLKAWDPSLSLALSGVSNDRAYRNFEMIAEIYHPLRRELPVLTAATLLVPGYVDAAEVRSIAGFIAKLDPGIPYSLLCFHPAHLMPDLPLTPLRQAAECYRAARRHLDNVNVGNLHLLGIRGMKEFRRRAEGI
jgi:pyruvate formate lyase activating enzyme